MKNLFVIGLLAVAISDVSCGFLGFPNNGSIFGNEVPFENSIFDDTTSSPVANPFPLPYDKEKLFEEIRNFGQEFLARSLNLKNYACYTNCFPINIYGMEIPQLLTIRALFRHLYGNTYNEFVQEKPLDLEKGFLDYDIIDKLKENEYYTVLVWNETLSATENAVIMSIKEFDSFTTMRDTSLEGYRSTFDITKLRETLQRSRYIFGRGLNKTLVIESLSRAIRNIKMFGSSLYHQQHARMHFGKFLDFTFEQLQQQISAILGQIYFYVYGVSTIEEINVGLRYTSLTTALVFLDYLNNVYGPVLDTIPQKPLVSIEERNEKIHLINNIKEMARNTIEMWQQNFKVLLKDYEDSKDKTDEYYRNFEQYTHFFLHHLSLEELRSVHESAIPLLGTTQKGYIPTESSDGN